MRRPSNKDYYNVLGISKTASSEEIKDAYRSLCKTYHPDIGGDAEKMKDINEAYSILSDESKKAEYDNPSFNQPQNPFAGGNPFEFHFGGSPLSGGGINLNDILNNLHGFKHFNGGGSAHNTFNISTIHRTIVIDLIKSLTGGEIQLEIPQIGKTIQFNLPKIVRSGQDFRIKINSDNNITIFLVLTVIVELPTDLSDKQIEKIVEVLKPLDIHTSEAFRTGSKVE